MYKVTATVSHPEAANSVVLEGLFVPKHGTAPEEKIKGQVSAHVRQHIRVSHGDITADDVCVCVVAEPFDFDFQLIEDVD